MGDLPGVLIFEKGEVPTPIEVYFSGVCIPLISLNLMLLNSGLVASNNARSRWPDKIEHLLERLQMVNFKSVPVHIPVSFMYKCKFLNSMLINKINITC